MINEYKIININNLPQLELFYQYEWNKDYKSYENIVDMLNSVFKMDKLSEEYTYVLSLNANLELKGIFNLSHGTWKSSLSSMRELGMFLLLTGAETFIFVHNHPNGILKESEDDIRQTEKIKNLSVFLNMEFMEHILITKNGYKLLIEGEIYER